MVKSLASNSTRLSQSATTQRFVLPRRRRKRTAIIATLIAFSIPEGPLISSIVEFARQANVQIIVPVRPLEGRRAAAVSGLITPQQGLERLLAPSGCNGLIQDRLIRLRCPATIAIS